MTTRRTYRGTYVDHRGETVGIRRTTTVASRAYTHAVIPYYTTRTTYLPSTLPRDHGLTVPHERPCEPWYGTPRFCSGLAKAQKQLKPGWLLIEVQEEDSA